MNVTRSGDFPKFGGTVSFFAPTDMRGKWHAKSIVTGEANCGSGAPLSDSDRIVIQRADIDAGKIHPIICRRCARLNRSEDNGQSIMS